MRFLSIYHPAPKSAGSPPDEEHHEKMGKLIEESMKAGTLLTTGALLPMSKGGACLRSAGGNITVLDGPYAEAKELVAGFAMLQYDSTAEAIESVRQFLAVAGDGECDLRQIMEPPTAAPLG